MTQVLVPTYLERGSKSNLVNPVESTAEALTSTAVPSSINNLGKILA
jgi:hypothetical protein